MSIILSTQIARRYHTSWWQHLGLATPMFYFYCMHTPNSEQFAADQLLILSYRISHSRCSVPNVVGYLLVKRTTRDSNSIYNIYTYRGRAAPQPPPPPDPSSRTRTHFGICKISLLYNNKVKFEFNIRLSNIY